MLVTQGDITQLRFVDSIILYLINCRKGVREGEELKAPRYASAAATRDGKLPLRDGNLPYVTANCLIPDIIS